MKIVFFIMAFLSLALSFVPCGDKAEIVEIHTMADLKNSDHQHSHSGTDTCTPFCHCSCCSSLTINKTTVLIYFPLAVEKIKVYYLPSEIIDAAIPVWQPPQLA